MHAVNAKKFSPVKLKKALSFSNSLTAFSDILEF